MPTFANDKGQYQTALLVYLVPMIILNILQWIVRNSMEPLFASSFSIGFPWLISVFLGLLVMQVRTKFRKRLAIPVSYIRG
jgi:positive regulator of sigma E activity